MSNRDALLAFAIVYALLSVAYVVTRRVQSWIDRWLAKKYEKEDEK